MKPLIIKDNLPSHKMTLQAPSNQLWHTVEGFTTCYTDFFKDYLPPMRVKYLVTLERGRCKMVGQHFSLSKDTPAARPKASTAAPRGRYATSAFRLQCGCLRRVV
ncbi:uncharacterized protein LOC144329299 [Podarcis muralis]